MKAGSSIFLLLQAHTHTQAHTQDTTHSPCCHEARTEAHCRSTSRQRLPHVVMYKNSPTVHSKNSPTYTVSSYLWIVLISPFPLQCLSHSSPPPPPQTHWHTRGREEREERGIVKPSSATRTYYRAFVTLGLGLNMRNDNTNTIEIQ